MQHVMIDLETMSTAPNAAIVAIGAVEFDLVILNNAYNKALGKPGWSYKYNRCYRTLSRELREQIPFERVGTHHHALDDAKSQALHCIKLLRKLHGT